MGYTHYWHQSRPISSAEWGALADATRTILKRAKSHGIALAREYDEPDSPPEITADLIRFNGIDDNGHETFYFERDAGSFAFCKTAHKDYDTAVIAVLIAARQACGALTWSSDGDAAEHADGLQLYNEALKQTLAESNARE